MSAMGQYVIEAEEKGALEYNDETHQYEPVEGVKDVTGRVIREGDRVKRVGLLGITKIFTVYRDSDGELRLDESGNRTSLIYPPLKFSRSFTYTILEAA